MSTLKVSSIIPVAGVPTGGGGGITQIKQAFKTDQFTDNSTNYVDITGLSVAITPTSTSSKILITCHVHCACTDAGMLRLLKGSSVIAVGTHSSSGNDPNGRGFALVRQEKNNETISATVEFLDSPSTTSETTYKIQCRAPSSSNPFLVNRRDSNDFYSLVSSITVMEVSA